MGMRDVQGPIHHACTSHGVQQALHPLHQLQDLVAAVALLLLLLLELLQNQLQHSIAQLRP
jgi:hypothetical protein